MSSRCLASRGEISASIFWSASFVFASERLKKTLTDPGQQLPAALDGLDGVGERRRLRVGDDGLDLLLLPGHAFAERGHEVLVPDPVERRGLEGRSVGGEERVRFRRRGFRGGQGRILLLRAGSQGEAQAYEADHPEYGFSFSFDGAPFQERECLSYQIGDTIPILNMAISFAQAVAGSTHSGIGR